MRVLLAAFLSLFAVAPGCTCSGTNRGDVNLVSLDDEWAMGRQLAAEVNAQTTPLADPAVQAYVDRMGQALADQTDYADRTWTFTVLADPAPNAFAIPGGHIYVNAGIVAAAETQDQLASVVAHEVAHGAARHSTERMVKAHGLSLVAGLVLGDDPGFVRQIVTEIAGQGALARFSRADEEEADELGLGLMAEAGYDPDGMAAMFETMTDAQGDGPGRVLQWFSTHPLGADRVAAAREAARTLDAEGDPATSDGVFRDVRRSALARVR